LIFNNSDLLEPSSICHDARALEGSGDTIPSRSAASAEDLPLIATAIARPPISDALCGETVMVLT